MIQYYIYAARECGAIHFGRFIILLTGKQKRYLRSMATTMEAIVQVGKNGVNDSVVFSLNEALAARELVKVKVLKNCMDEVAEVAEALALASGAEVAQVIGRHVLLYRPHPQKPVIVLPK